MNLLFIHSSEKVKEDDYGNLYTDGSYSEEVWNRYLSLTDNLSILMRKDKKKYTEDECVKKFNYFNKNKIKFIEIDDLMNSTKSFFNINKRRKNNKTIEKSILNCDFAIIRVPSTIGNRVTKILKKNDIPYLVEVVGCPWDSLWNHSLKGKILAPIMYIKTRLVVKNAEYVQYVSNEFLQKRYPTKGHSIGCSDVQLEKNTDITLQKRIKKINSMKKNNKLILGTLGAIDIKYKGHRYVLKAISKLKKEGINIEYQIVGGGNNKNLLKLTEKLNIKNNVIFKGSIAHEQVFSWLENIDVYVQPSESEGLCRAVIEAMSMSCPCIVSSAGGNPELIDDILVFKKKKTTDLIKKIKLLINNNELLVQSAKNNFYNSKKYEKSLLDSKRKSFHNVFLNALKKKQKEIKNEL